MTFMNLPGSFIFDSDYDENEINEILRENDDYILALARKKVPHHTAPREVLDLEIQELAQRSRIKLWCSLKQRKITRIKAYIRSIIHSESIDMIRRSKFELSLPLDEEGELYQGKVLAAPGEGMQDPLYELVQQEKVSESITQVVKAMRSLPPRQQQAMICSLEDKLDDVSTLTQAFKKFGINTEAARWPSKKFEVQSYRASLTIARKKLKTIICSEVILTLKTV